jgi:transglutaminase-like putative cysteine protease
MLLKIEHHTHYSYSDFVNYTIQQLRLTPNSENGQYVRRWDIKVKGELHPFIDAYRNISHRLIINEPHKDIDIVAIGEVETGLDKINHQDYLPLSIFLRNTKLTEANQKLIKFAQKFKATGDEQIDALEKMMHAILNHVEYIKGVTQVTTTASEAFQLRKGVCQDHAHIFIACCHALNLPARYVSGYMFTEDGHLMQSHAWAEVWLDKMGWQSFDVSNGCKVNDLYVRLAIGLDYKSASPVVGVRLGGGSEGMASSVIINQSNTPFDKRRKIDKSQLIIQATQQQQ